MTAKTSRENVVEVVEIKFGYANREVLKGLSLTIPRGKVVAILGASGCGKTSLLRMIGGQLRPKRGHVKVDGCSAT
jgi:phospholipid/cholesterol/gamma-HCH transport system ATP-binding protein